MLFGVRAVFCITGTAIFPRGWHLFPFQAERNIHALLALSLDVIPSEHSWHIDWCPLQHSVLLSNARYYAAGKSCVEEEAQRQMNEVMKPGHQWQVSVYLFLKPHVTMHTELLQCADR